MHRRRLLSTLLSSTALAAALLAPAAQAKELPAAIRAATGNLDVRVNGAPGELQKAAGLRPDLRSAAGESRLAARSAALGQAVSRLQATAPGAEVRFDRLTGAVEVVRNPRGALSAPAAGSGEEIVRNFLSTHRTLYGLDDTDLTGLRFLGESVSPSGLRMVRVEQTVGGLPVFQSESRFLLDREGRLVRTVGLFAPEAQAGAEPLALSVLPKESLAAALRAVGITATAKDMRRQNTAPGNLKTELLVPGHAAVRGAVPTELVWFPLAPGLLVPAWKHVIFTAGEGDFYTVVDARTGDVLWRKNIRQHASTQQARFSVYLQPDGVTPADNPAPQSPATVVPGSGTQFPEIARTTASMLTVQNILASPNGWIPDGGTTTTGNNVDACLDRVVLPAGTESNVCDLGALDNNGRPVGNPDAFGLSRDFLGNAPRDYTYSPPPVGGVPTAGDSPLLARFQRGAVTQLFYTANWYHDRLFSLGFDEAAGNFQQTNFSGFGLGNDRVRADAQDGSSVDNANFSTPPDGQSGRMQMYIFSGPNPDRDGGLDAEIVIHELTHGLSNRLVGNATGLNWDPGSGMGEGWSDFYALSLLNAGDNPDAQYTVGSYATYRLAGLPFTDNYLYGIRRFPYSTDNTVNPMTWADVDDTTVSLTGGIPTSPINFTSAGAYEVHNVGELWALSLWEVRSRVIASVGSLPKGNEHMLQLVTDALKMTPINPSFIDARDALFDADCATNSCRRELQIWQGFADRGLGYKAGAPLGVVGASRVGTTGRAPLGESFSLPYLDVASVAIDDSLGNGDGAIDPGEQILLTVSLFNPWRMARRGVPYVKSWLTTLNPGIVRVHDDTALFGPLPAQGTTTAGDTFLIAVGAAVPCGSTLTFNLLTGTTVLGMTNTQFTLRVGTPSGPGTPVTYTRVIPGGLGIPDNNLLGVTDTLNVPDDLDIADLNVRVDSLTHPFTGDLSVEVKGPTSYGADLIHFPGVFLGGTGGSGDNFVNTVIDDDLAFLPAFDLNQQPATAAPFTGSWLPAFNSPIWALFGIPNFTADPVGQLARFDGTSSKGDWKLHLTDGGATDVGTLSSWSLIVTPTLYVCH